MLYRWLVFAAGAILLAVLAWYFGRPVVPVQHASNESVGVAAATPKAEAPRETSPKVPEVIDLARAYDPVREVETTSPGGVNPASFIEEQYAPARIPYAADEDKAFRDLLIQIREMPFGTFLLGVVPAAETIDIKPREVQRSGVLTPMIIQNWISEILSVNDQISGAAVRLDVMPREVATIQNGLIDFVPTPPSATGQVFTPMCVPFQTGITQPIPPNASIQNGLLNFTPSNEITNEPVRLDVMPREVK